MTGDSTTTARACGSSTCSKSATRDFRGLNLSYEAREGILKHGSDWPHPVPIPDVGAQPGLEAQVADHSDEIAYTVHDLDDGLRSGLLNQADLKCVRLWNETHQRVLDELGAALPRRNVVGGRPRLEQLCLQPSP